MTASAGTAIVMFLAMLQRKTTIEARCSYNVELARLVRRVMKWLGGPRGSATHTVWLIQHSPQIRRTSRKHRRRFTSEAKACSFGPEFHIQAVRNQTCQPLHSTSSTDARSTKSTCCSSSVHTPSRGFPHGRCHRMKCQPSFSQLATCAELRSARFLLEGNYDTETRQTNVDREATA